MKDTLAFTGICIFTAVLWSMAIISAGEDERPHPPHTTWLIGSTTTGLACIFSPGEDAGMCLPPHPPHIIWTIGGSIPDPVCVVPPGEDAGMCLPPHPIDRKPLAKR